MRHIVLTDPERARLEKLLRHAPNARVSCHSARESRSLARQLDITLIWLPPRSPQLNPVDRLWNCAKQHVCANRQYGSIEEQERLFIEYLQDLSGDEALRKAGLRANNFWLFRERASRA